jgi:predicted secreted protein
MNWKSALAIYMLFWVMSVFFILPIGMRTASESGQPLVPGQAESAPANFSFKRIAMRTTMLATALFALFYVNYVNGWITAEMVASWLPQP